MDRAYNVWLQIKDERDKFSNEREQLIEFFLSNPDVEFNSSDISNLVYEGYIGTSNARKILNFFEKRGLIEMHNIEGKRQAVFKLNKDYAQ